MEDNILNKFFHSYDKSIDSDKYLYNQIDYVISEAPKKNKIIKHYIYIVYDLDDNLCVGPYLDAIDTFLSSTKISSSVLDDKIKYSFIKYIFDNVDKINKVINKWN